MATIVKDWITKAGLRAVINLNNHHCGYVAVPKSHPLYGIAYSQPAPPPITMDYLKDQPIGKRGIIDLMCNAMKTDERPDVGFLFDVHGGITYSGSGNRDYPAIGADLWWFGYDCAHAGDLQRGEMAQYAKPGAAWRDETYCEAECESLAEQLKSVGELIDTARSQAKGKP